MSATIITIVGNLTADPELKFTPSGAAVVNFTVAASDRVLDKATNEWRDGEATFIRCSIWRTYAENIAESLTKGSRVVVTGKLKSRTYETPDGAVRTVYEVEADEVGVALRYATATITRRSRADGAGQTTGLARPSDDPWATPADRVEIPF